jgi:RNA polymerase sigma-70 factor (ECF subfamily)
MPLVGSRSPTTTRDDAEFSAAYGRYFAPVRAHCRRMLRSAEADDVAHEAFARLWEAKPVFPEGADTRATLAWLYRTSTRVAIDLLRARGVRDRREAVAEGQAALPCAAAPLEAIEARQIIRRLVAEIPNDELEAAVLCRVSGVTQPEAAEILAVSERTVRRLLDRFEERIGDLRKEEVHDQSGH